MQSSAVSDRSVRDVVVVGSGFSGLAMGVALKGAGIDSFEILEKADRVGGTWRENTYPGAACDVPSHLYSFSFEPKPDWTRTYSPQEEIRQYLEHVVRKYGLGAHLSFGSRMTEARYDDEAAIWTITLSDGRTLRARALVLGHGALHVPHFPELKGLASFAGEHFHSSAWNHDYDLRGKRVAVIGTGASAIQFVPRIVPQVAALHLYQRSAPWIVPRADRAFGTAERLLFGISPALRRAYRTALYWRHEWRALGFVYEPRVLRIGERMARRHLEESVRDPALREALTPRYRMGCKRVLISDDFYPALQEPNVELVTDAIETVEPNGIRTRDGRLREVDAILFGTGFRTTEFPLGMQVYGAGGRSFHEAWAASPEAYLGITFAGFPNLFMLTGPNTGLAHNSMIFMIEAQARYVLQCIRLLRERSYRSIEVRADVQSRFNAGLRRRLEGAIWASGCTSWYQTREGQNVALWPGFTFDYWLRTRRIRSDDFVLRK